MQSHIPDTWITEIAAMFRGHVRELYKDKSTEEISKLLKAYQWSREEGRNHNAETVFFAQELSEILIDRIVECFAARSIPDYHFTHYERRLALTVWALRNNFVAAAIHSSLPGKPGMASAHAFATVYSDPERYLPGGNYQPSEGGYSLQGPSPTSDPVANGVRWLTRLRSDVSRGKKRGEFISPLLLYLDHTVETHR